MVNADAQLILQLDIGSKVFTKAEVYLIIYIQQ
jgi:hypothetical protein